MARLEHYFSTYKHMYDQTPITTVESVYDTDHAQQVIAASIEDYDEEYGR